MTICLEPTPYYYGTHSGSIIFHTYLQDLFFLPGIPSRPNSLSIGYRMVLLLRHRTKSRGPVVPARRFCCLFVSAWLPRLYYGAGIYWVWTDVHVIIAIGVPNHNVEILFGISHTVCMFSVKMFCYPQHFIYLILYDLSQQSYLVKINV